MCTYSLSLSLYICTLVYVRYGMVWYGNPYGMVWYGMVWYGMATHTVWYGMVWYGMV